MTRAQKLQIVRFLIFLRSKLERLAFDLLIEGKDTTEIDKAQKRLDKSIRKLRQSLMQSWQTSAKATMDELRRANRNIQDNIRELKADMSKVDKITKIVGKIDDVVALAGKLLT